jgi:hypothetical protein
MTLSIHWFSATPNERADTIKNPFGIMPKIRRSASFRLVRAAPQLQRVDLGAGRIPL